MYIKDLLKYTDMGIKRWIINNFRHDRNVRKIAYDQLEELSKIKNQVIEIKNQIIYNYYWDKTLNCNQSGVSGEKICNEEVVVSLTTFGDRINYVHIAIESIMQQTIKPNRIVLWLAKDEFKNKTLPVALQMQQKRGLQIEYCEDLKSYNKLIPSLKRFPEASIITIDDDAVYYANALELLIRAHKSRPLSICASRIHGVLLDEEGLPRPYNEWQYCVNDCPKVNNLAFFTTGAGVLYPPHCFTDEVFNDGVFMTMSEKADDVWFNAMRLLNNVNVIKVFGIESDGNYTSIASSDINPLNTLNCSGGNDKAIMAVYGHYGLFEKLKS